MNKKTVKVISALIIILFVILSATPVFAALTPNDVPGTGNIADNDIKKVGNNIATIVRSIGIVAAVVILMVIGIKYMVASAEEKAKYKEVMIPYVIGAVILFGAAMIVSFIMNFDITQ